MVRILSFLIAALVLALIYMILKYKSNHKAYKLTISRFSSLLNEKNNEIEQLKHDAESLSQEAIAERNLRINAMDLNNKLLSKR